MMEIIGLDTLWVLVGAALVFFMQAGFAMVETGFTRAKNSGNIIMKNLMDFAIGTVVFFLIGFGLMFATGNGFIGGLDLFIQGDYSQNGLPSTAVIIFQTVFCATSATIVSGAMAERTKFSAYLIYSALMSAFVYPISGHWIWGGGWLADLGFHDFAGSTAVHMVGGIAALIGAKIIGARIGKFDKNKKPKAIPGHSLTLGALGVFILWFCWFGFNGASTLGMTGSGATIASNIFVTTNIAAATSTTATMIITWIKYKKPDVSMTLNGSLAGLVAITAGCDCVSPIGALFIGLIAAFVVVFGIEFVEKVLKIDDPVGAIGVHGFCGATGTLLVGLFAVNEGSAFYNNGMAGLFYGGGFKLLGIQALGVVSVAAWVVVTMIIIFLALKYTIGLRVPKHEEIVGLDIMEHGLATSYAGFVFAGEKELESVGSAPVSVTLPSGSTEEKAGEIPVDKAIPIVTQSISDTSLPKMTKVVVITKETMFESLKHAVEQIGITGMSVSKILGCGMQRGGSEFYRGVKLDATLLPKVKVEIVVCKTPVSSVVDVIKKALYTGNIGDGKIFIYNVENVIKIRTGEEGYDALQDE